MAGQMKFEHELNRHYVQQFEKKYNFKHHELVCNFDFDQYGT